MNVVSLSCAVRAVVAIALSFGMLSAAQADWLPKTYFVYEFRGKTLVTNSSNTACQRYLQDQNTLAAESGSKGRLSFRRAIPLGTDVGGGFATERQNEGDLDCEYTYSPNDGVTPPSTGVSGSSSIDMVSPCGRGPTDSFGEPLGYDYAFRNKLKYCKCSGSLGYVERYQRCVPTEQADQISSTDKSAGGGSSCDATNNTGTYGNPINPATGAKYLQETDYDQGAGGLKLQFIRSYNSVAAGSAFSFADGYRSADRESTIGRGWRHTYERSEPIQNFVCEA